ncbi:winged helix-turn-helix domain-containing protein, partial [Streptomyces sp. NPDC052644]
MLALLLLYANQVVPVTAIMTELWDATAPRSAQTTVQTYILRLRKLLATVAGCSPQQVSRELLKTKSSGYLLQVGPGALDLHRFDQCAAKGRRAHSVGDNESAARLLD